MLRTINNLVRTLLIQAHMPHSYWVEALHTTVYTLNLLPSSSIQNNIPYTRLFQLPASYSHLRVFGCLCYRSTFSTSPHKLAPRSVACIFLGYPTNHRGYRCLVISTRKIIISRHVNFVEDVFPFSTIPFQPQLPFHSDEVPTSYTSSHYCSLALTDGSSYAASSYSRQSPYGHSEQNWYK